MKRTQTAFSLVELMVTLTLLAILMAMATPSFREFSRNNRVTAAHNDLVTAFTLARNEALKRSTPVSVCASSNGTACTGETNWAVGWIVFEDGSGAVGTVNGPDDDLLQVYPAAHGQLTLEGTKAFVRFAPSGTVLPDGAKTVDVRVTGCSGPHMRRLTVSAVGSLTATKQNCP